ncbi:MAG: T9SS type A sorting domain-containing protein [Bacteroidota bacterium]
MKKRVLLLLMTVISTATSFAQFSGNFAPANWTYSSTTAGGDGSINTSGAPASIILNGSDNNMGCCSLYENYVTTITTNGTISFSYSMVQPDIDNSYYVINGVTTLIASSTTSGTKSNIAVSAGNTFAFRIINDDNCCGRGVLTVSNFVFTPATPLITVQPTNKNVCAATTTTFSITATNTTSYQWQENTGSGFTNITNGGIYSNATTATLTLTGVTTAMSGYTYQCIATGSVSPAATSNTASLTVNANVTPTFTAVTPFCSGSAAPVLPTTSNNSFTGTWSPAVSNTVSGTYTFTPTAGQCATTTTLGVTVNNPSSYTSSLTACGSAVINGITYTTSQTVTNLFSEAAANGCDSTHITNLTIKNPSTYTSSLSACGSAVINGVTYTTSQTVTNIFPNGAANGCDSTHITNLTIKNPSTYTSSLTSCGSAVINGVTYTTSQTVTNVFPNGAANGCDSTHITNLTIKVPPVYTSSLTACETAVINGVMYASSDIVTDVFTGGAANGCDSTHITNLTITHAAFGNSSLTICDTAVINGNTYTSSQIVTDLYSGGAANGCDSTHVTDLTINHSVTVSTALTACESAVINGNTYTTSQTVTDIFPGATQNGCDSTHVTLLTINHAAVATGVLTACESAFINGNIYTSSQIVTDVFPEGAANGCDSIYITDLTINHAVISNRTLTACESAVINGTTYTTSQIVTDVFPEGAANGCDSTCITDLTIHYAVITNSALTACESAVVNGNTYTSSQIITDLFMEGAANGCDSTHITDLTINHGAISNATITSCESAVINGYTYTTSQIVTDVFPGAAVNGCDSTHITDLTINYAKVDTSILMVCESAVINGNTYTSSQIVTDVFTEGAATGCDSTHITYLIVKHTVISGGNVTACESAVINGNTYTSSQTVTDIYPEGASTGCDSIYITILTIEPAVDLTTTTSGATITANQAGANYQWMDCMNGYSIINGANAQSYTAITSGSYEVQVTKGTCTGISQCAAVTVSGIQSHNSRSLLNIYPNPNNGSFSVASSREGVYHLINSVGQEIKSFVLTEEINFKITIDGLADGIYMLTGNSGNHLFREKIIVTK